MLHFTLTGAQHGGEQTQRIQVGLGTGRTRPGPGPGPQLSPDPLNPTRHLLNPRGLSQTPKIRGSETQQGRTCPRHSRLPTRGRLAPDLIATVAVLAPQGSLSGPGMTVVKGWGACLPVLPRVHRAGHCSRPEGHSDMTPTAT